MKTFLLLVFVAFMAFVLINRERVFVRDPLATVYLNSTKQSGFQVYINYSNDVLIERDAQPTGFGVLVQRWNLTPATPAGLQCIHWMACMTDADHATTLPLDDAGPKYAPKTSMSSREVSFTEPSGDVMRITLR